MGSQCPISSLIILAQLHVPERKKGGTDLNIFFSRYWYMGADWGTSTEDMAYTWRQKILDPVKPTTKPWENKTKISCEYFLKIGFLKIHQKVHIKMLERAAMRAKPLKSAQMMGEKQRKKSLHKKISSTCARQTGDIFLGGKGWKFESQKVQNHIQNASQHRFYCLPRESGSWNPAVAGKVPPMLCFITCLFQTWTQVISFCTRGNKNRCHTCSFCWCTGKLLALMLSIPLPEKHNMSS